MPQKGEYGYLNARMRKQAGLSIFGLAIIIATIVVGYLRYHTRANIFTIAAALVAIPTAKVLVGFIICIKNKSPERTQYDRLKEIAKTPYILSDLLLTSRENMMPFEFAIISANNLCLYTTNKKMDKRKAENYIRDYIKAEVKNINVKVVDDYNAIIKAAARMVVKEKGNYDTEETIKNTLLILQY